MRAAPSDGGPWFKKNGRQDGATSEPRERNAETAWVHRSRPHPSTVDPAASHSRIILAIVLAVGLLDVIDFSIVFVALPSIQTDLRIPLAESQWIVGAYGLTLAGFLMLSGRAGDVYGQKRLFLGGISLFTVASFVAGLSPSFLPLVIARGFQGVGAAITSATALAILAATFPEGKARNRALGVFVAALSAGFAAGSLLGGVLTAAFGWRSVLFVNVPVGITAAVLAQRFLTRDVGRTEDRHLDLPGALAVTSGLLLLVYALTNAAEFGFAAVLTTIPLALATVVLALFVVLEHRSPAPLMPLGFLRRGTILRANVLGLILAASPPGILFILTIFMQEILGYSALSTALAFLPATLVFFVVGGWGASRLVNRFGMRRVLVLSSGLMTAGVALLTQISPAGGYLGILPGFLVWSFGASIGFPAVTIAGLAGTRPGEEGLASGLINTSQRLGGPVGLAVFLTIIGAAQSRGVAASAVTSQAPVVVGFQEAFVAMVLLNLVGVFVALRIRHEHERGRPPVG